MISNPDIQTRIAYHEAGHAVIAYLRGVRLLHIRLYFADNKWHGGTDIEPSYFSLDNPPSQLYTMLLIHTAGMIAEDLLFGSISPDSETDKQWIWGFSNQLACIEQKFREPSRYREQADRDAEEILRLHMDALSAVASRLLQSEVTSFDEFTDIMKGFVQ